MIKLIFSRLSGNNVRAFAWEGFSTFCTVDLKKDKSMKTFGETNDFWPFAQGELPEVS